MPLATIFGKSIGCQFHGDDGQRPGFSGWKTTTIILRLFKHNCVQMVVLRWRAIRLKGALNALGFYVHRGSIGGGLFFHIFLFFLFFHTCLFISFSHSYFCFPPQPPKTVSRRDVTSVDILLVVLWIICLYFRSTCVYPTFTTWIWMNVLPFWPAGVRIYLTTEQLAVADHQ